MKLDINKDKYIILEIIPSHSNHELGIIVQLSALKMEGLKLISRFDYRLTDDLVKNPDLLNLISYDKEMFTYVKSEYELREKFKEFIESYPLLIIDNSYTPDYLNSFENSKESIFNYLNLTYSDDVFSILIDKYHLQPTNHLVDLLYESLIYESNN